MDGLTHCGIFVKDEELLVILDIYRRMNYEESHKENLIMYGGPVKSFKYQGYEFDKIDYDKESYSFYLFAEDYKIQIKLDKTSLSGDIHKIIIRKNIEIEEDGDFIDLSSDDEKINESPRNIYSFSECIKNFGKWILEDNKHSMYGFLMNKIAGNNDNGRRTRLYISANDETQKIVEEKINQTKKNQRLRDDNNILVVLAANPEIKFNIETRRYEENESNPLKVHHFDRIILFLEYGEKKFNKYFNPTQYHFDRDDKIIMKRNSIFMEEEKEYNQVFETCHNMYKIQSMHDMTLPSWFCKKYRLN